MNGGQQRGNGRVWGAVAIGVAAMVFLLGCTAQPILTGMAPGQVEVVESLGYAPALDREAAQLVQRAGERADYAVDGGFVGRRASLRRLSHRRTRRCFGGAGY